MRKIIQDRAGDLRERVFYRLGVPFNDEITAGVPTPNWFVVHRTPVNDAFVLAQKDTYMWIEMTGDWDTRVETMDCPLDNEHVTHRYLTNSQGEAYGGTRLSPLIVTSDCDTVILSGELRRRFEPLRIRGARIDPLDLRKGDAGPKLKDFWILQFIGRAKLRLPKIMDTQNLCPYCNRGKIMCDGCGEWYAYCLDC